MRARLALILLRFVSEETSVTGRRRGVSKVGPCDYAPGLRVVHGAERRVGGGGRAPAGREVNLAPVGRRDVEGAEARRARGGRRRRLEVFAVGRDVEDV